MRSAPPKILGKRERLSRSTYEKPNERLLLGKQAAIVFS
jgi:hypothetical protein